MKTDNVEWRVGIEMFRASEFVKGNGETTGSDKFEEKVKLVESRHFIYPGIAYHFSNTNLLDVYVGAELPLGFERSVYFDEWQEGSNSYLISSKRTAYNVGLGGFIGLQAYVANLPIAIGFEYGIAGLKELGLKTRTETESPGNSKVVTYQPNGVTIAGYSNYEKLNARKGIIGNQLRFTVTYFFN
jgi:hypothetical protein